MSRSTVLSSDRKSLSFRFVFVVVGCGDKVSAKKKLSSTSPLCGDTGTHKSICWSPFPANHHRTPMTRRLALVRVWALAFPVCRRLPVFANNFYPFTTKCVHKFGCWFNKFVNLRFNTSRLLVTFRSFEENWLRIVFSWVKRSFSNCLVTLIQLENEERIHQENRNKFLFWRCKLVNGPPYPYVEPTLTRVSSRWREKINVPRWKVSFSLWVRVLAFPLYRSLLMEARFLMKFMLCKRTR
jgi:hypothetical protein